MDDTMYMKPGEEGNKEARQKTCNHGYPVKLCGKCKKK